MSIVQEYMDGGSLQVSACLTDPRGAVGTVGLISALLMSVWLSGCWSVQDIVESGGCQDERVLAKISMQVRPSPNRTRRLVFAVVMAAASCLECGRAGCRCVDEAGGGGVWL